MKIPTMQDPGYTLLKITEIYAFVSSDERGEGVIGGLIGGVFTPLIAADKARVDSLRNYAERIKKETGRKITLVKFTTREEIEEI